MRWMIAAGAALLLAQAGGHRLAAGLRPGLRLVYGSGTQLQEPWVIDSVRLAEPLRAASDCAVIHQRRSANARTEEIRLCLARDTLYRWRAADSSWAIARPVGAAMVWSSTRSGGGALEYRTGEQHTDTISGLVIPVVATTVTTLDAGGRAIRRLRERYAVSLATATGGTFEEPDSSTGGWRTTQTFALREIRGP